MSQPVKLSDALVMDARIEGAAMERSIAGQVEFWAKLGRSMERLMTGRQMGDIRRKPSPGSLSKRIESINQPEGRARLAAYLDSKPYPHFIADPILARVFIREDADGTRTPGLFKGREFTALDDVRGTAAE